MDTNNGLILGTTLFSFTNEWKQRLYDLDALIARVADLGLGPAVEVVGFQTFRGFPEVTDEFASYFRSMLDRYGLIPSCLGANLDVGIRKKRLMTSAETLAYVERQINAAQKLGFPVVRIQAFAKPNVLEKIVPIAEKAGVHVASELHSPLTIDNPEVIELLEFYRRIQSPALGFIPDFSCTMTAVPEGFWNGLRQMGAPEALINSAKEIWKSTDATPVNFGRLQEACRSVYATPAISSQINMALTMFGHMAVDGWQEILPYTRHIHGKFYEVNSYWIEPYIPYPQLMNLLKKVRFTGTISAEWEGQAFTEDLVGFEQVQAWHSMCKRLLDQ
jgi:hypothetical protein